jgi:hypothetical protein
MTVIAGAARKVHHATTRCQAYNRYAVSHDWAKVTCKFCLKTTKARKPEPALPEGVERAVEACRCGDCHRCICRKRGQR